LRKFLAYQALWRARLHTQAFGWRNFRVLIVTTNGAHMETMRGVLGRHAGGKGSALFWFAERETLKACNTLEHVWIDGEGNERRLLPRE
jgi:hypothetical protein